MAESIPDITFHTSLCFCELDWRPRSRCFGLGPALELHRSTGFPLPWMSSLEASGSGPRKSLPRHLSSPPTYTHTEGVQWEGWGRVGAERSHRPLLPVGRVDGPWSHLTGRVAHCRVSKYVFAPLGTRKNGLMLTSLGLCQHPDPAGLDLLGQRPHHSFPVPCRKPSGCVRSDKHSTEGLWAVRRALDPVSGPRVWVLVLPPTCVTWEVGEATRRQQKKGSPLSLRKRGGKQATGLRRGSLDRWEGHGVGAERSKTGPRQGGGWGGSRGLGRRTGEDSGYDRQCWGADCISKGARPC